MYVLAFLFSSVGCILFYRGSRLKNLHKRLTNPITISNLDTQLQCGEFQTCQIVGKLKQVSPNSDTDVSRISIEDRDDENIFGYEKKLNEVVLERSRKTKIYKRLVQVERYITKNQFCIIDGTDVSLSYFLSSFHE